MKTIKTFFFALICFLPQIVDSQVNPNVNFYPIRVGNVWQYKVHTEGNFLDGDTSYYMKRTIVSDTIMKNGKKYYKAIPMQPDPPINFSYYSDYSNYIRIDSVTANVYYYNGIYNFEGIIDTLAALPGDRHFVLFYAGEPKSLHQFAEECLRIDTVNLFNTLTTVKKFVIPINGNFKSYDFAEGIGKIYQKEFFAWIIGYHTIYELVYAKINGKEYGTFVGVDEQEIIPSKYSLAQNYPNPFNPTTTIRFSIPIVETLHSTSLQYVTLKIFDLLGNQIVTLVNEEKLPGSYEVLFDGSKLASGVYFYTLATGNFSQTKKLLLVK